MNKQFAAPLSAKSWIVLTLGFYPFYWVVFRPTAWEFGVWCAVEFASVALVSVLEPKWFLKRYPKSKAFFPTFNLEQTKTLTVDEKLAIYQELIRFPAVRAAYCVVVSYLKMALPMAVVLFYWKYDQSAWWQATQFILTESVMYAYFYGAIFIEKHGEVSETIAELHCQYDWRDVFKRVNALDGVKKDIERNQNIVIGSVLFLLLLVQATLILSPRTFSREALALSVLSTTLIAGLQVSWIWHLGRSYFRKGLELFFETLAKWQPNQTFQSLPLHSSAYLARFGQSTNLLLEKIHQYEEELLLWSYRRTEESRYEAIGEISALIAHELANPLHVILFCATEMGENRDDKEKLLEQLKLNAERCETLINSLRQYLRSPSPTTSKVRYGDLHGHIQQLLELRFGKELISEIDFQIDPSIGKLPELAITWADLIHIALNLLTNAINHRGQHEGLRPTIRISARALETSAAILFSDNGKGLTRERFAQLTDFSMAHQSDHEQGGLGLRLIGRLATRYAGEIAWEAPEAGFCTTIGLRLPYHRDSIGSRSEVSTSQGASA